MTLPHSIGTTTTTATIRFVSLLMYGILLVVLMSSFLTMRAVMVVDAFVVPSSIGQATRYNNIAIQPSTQRIVMKAMESQDINGAQSDDGSADDNDLVARRIVVTGKAVQGGYYRSCVLNEAGRFRRLVGTMTPPEDCDADEAEIYVEGKRKLVEGFVRWCQRANVGLNQLTKVKEVIEEEPTGLYDEFYVKTK